MAYFFPLGVMLVAYTASIRLLGQQAAGSRLRWGSAAGNGNDDPSNVLRRSRSGRRHANTMHSGARTPEVYVSLYRSRRDEGTSRSATGSVRSLRDQDATSEHGQQQRSQHDRSLSPLLSCDDCRAPSTSCTPSSSFVRTESASRRKTVVEQPLTFSGGSERTSGNANEPGTLIPQHSCSEVGQKEISHVRLLSDDVDPPTQKSFAPSIASTIRTTTADVMSGNEDLVTHASGRRFRSLVQKHSSTLRAVSELLSHRDDIRQTNSHVATAVAAAAAIRTVRTERKAARVIGAVFAVFVTCWTPFFVLNLSLGVCGPSCQQAVIGTGALYPVFLWLGYVASTLNPIVYTAFNGTFRRTFADLLTCRRRPCTRSLPYVASSMVRRRNDFVA